MTVGNPTEVQSFLRQNGAGRLPHAHGRSLEEHLVGTADILTHWGQPAEVCAAGLIHSIYSTDVYAKQLVPFARRQEVQAVAGLAAENAAYLFCVVSRKEFLALFAEGSRPPADRLELPCRPGAPADCVRLTLAELATLLKLHLANELEQARSSSGGALLGRAELLRLGRKLLGIDPDIPAIFEMDLLPTSPADERDALHAHRMGLDALNETDSAVASLTTAMDRCEWAAEPRVWLAYLALRDADLPRANAHLERASALLRAWGTPWDKRLSYEQWAQVISNLCEAASDPGLARALPVFKPGYMRRFMADLAGWSPAPGATPPPMLDTGAGRPRFHRYVDAFAGQREHRPMRIYPGLRAQPWHDPADFPLARALEEAYPEIRREVLAMGDGGYHAEAEPIQRDGAWDVLLLYPRGRKNEELCAKLPTAARIIESHRTVRTLAGLTYVSKLSPGSHIAAHTGPTNLRLRCHLGIQVPAGDCAITVGGEARQWHEGKCLVFDDHFVHEAWNRTDGQRIVLIVDLWHPDLTDEEVNLLTGLHRYASLTGASLGRYWADNAKAAARANPNYD